MLMIVISCHNLEKSNEHFKHTIRNDLESNAKKRKH